MVRAPAIRLRPPQTCWPLQLFSSLTSCQLAAQRRRRPAGTPTKAEKPPDAQVCREERLRLSSGNTQQQPAGQEGTVHPSIHPSFCHSQTSQLSSPLSIFLLSPLSPLLSSSLSPPRPPPPLSPLPLSLHSSVRQMNRCQIRAPL